MNDKTRIVWGICGSFCTLRAQIDAMKQVMEEQGGCELIPVVSETAATTDTRFGKAADFLDEIAALCRRPPVLTIADAEPIGPQLHPDLAVVAPATGNTLAKLALSITDTPVTMAVKSTLRSGAPVLLSLATNDALNGNLKNIGLLAAMRPYFFVPLRQDSPSHKPFSLVADPALLPAAVAAALAGHQIRPMFLE